MDDRLENYLMHSIEPREDWMHELESLAKEERIPIMEPLGIDYVRQMIRIKKPKKILEIGTAIGYSALMMADAWPESQIVTIERDEKRYRRAKEHITTQSKQDNIQVLFGDALEISDKVKEKGPYDLLFIDAAKGQYRRFFDIYTEFLQEDGIVLSDNVLFKGLVSGEQQTDQKRLSTIASKLKDYNDWLIQNPAYHTTIVPIGDGIAVSVKKREHKEKGDN